MYKKVLLILILIGIVLVATGFILAKGDITNIIDSFTYDEDYEYVEKSGVEEFTELHLDLVSSSITFHINESEGYKLDYYESEYDKKEVKVEDGKLIVENDIKRRWFIFRFTSSKISKFNIYLPNTFTGKVVVKNTSGSVNISNFNFNSLDINVTSGNVNLEKLEIVGDIKLKVISGNSKLVDVKANNLYTQSTSGDLEIKNAIINNLGDFVFTSGTVDIINSKFAKTNVTVTSGNVDLIDIECDNLDITVTSGDTDIVLYGKAEDYKVDLRVTSGRVYYQGIKTSSGVINPNGSKLLKINSTSGNIDIEFKTK